MKFICQNPTCAIAISKAAFPAAMNCPVCAQALVELIESNELNDEEENLIASLPYVIAYPLKETLLPIVKRKIMYCFYRNYGAGSFA